MKKPINENYAAIVVEIKTIVPIANCDNVVHAIIMGNQVVVGKDIKMGEIGLYFSLETQLSETYLKVNNLYRKSELNADPTQKGYFEENGRIRCVKFRQNKSEGLFMPLVSLDTLCNTDNLKPGDCFDEIDGIKICEKYVIKKHNTPGAPGSKKGKKAKVSRIIETQFRFHDDTSMLYKNLHRINPDDIISISYKLHGTSGISSRILCKRYIPIREKIGTFLHNIYTNVTSLGKQSFKLEETEYTNIYSSRKVVKNDELNPNTQSFYDTDIWGIANEYLKEHLQSGMTFYYEIVGYLPTGAMIQKDYDYGYTNPILDTVTPKYTLEKHYGIYIYRITYTNITGKVFEFSFKQVQDFCKENGLKAVPQLFYGYPEDFLSHKVGLNCYSTDTEKDKEYWKTTFLEVIKSTYNEKDCFMCKTQVPEEGVVIRIEKNQFEAYKQKSNRFYERETKLLDKDESNIEDEN